MNKLVAAPQLQAKGANSFTQFQKSEGLLRCDLATGVANIVKTACICRGDRALIITDNKALCLGEKIRDAARAKGARTAILNMDDFGKRPLLSLPAKVAREIRALRPTVSFFAAAKEEGEGEFREPLIRLLTEKIKARQVHMPGITPEIAGGEAMCADYDRVYETTHKVLNIVRRARRILVSSPNGTRLSLELDPKNLKWYACDGKITKKEQFGNMPGGEVFTSPANVNGVLVSRVLGDYFEEKYGLLKEPLRIVIKNGRAVAVHHRSMKFRKEMVHYLNKRKNADRVGELGIGTNTNITAPTGRLAEDEKFPGAHMAFGDPSSHETKAKWKCNQHCDMVIENCTITVDRKTIMKDGKFLI